MVRRLRGWRGARRVVVAFKGGSRGSRRARPGVIPAGISGVTGERTEEAGDGDDKWARTVSG